MATDSQLTDPRASTFGVPQSKPRDVAVEVRGLAKTFRIPTLRVDTAKERFAGLFRRPAPRLLEVLRDIDFEIYKGEFFGIVGRNGSGKSTLLKLLASIYRADAGRIRIAGRIAPCIELGVGFNTELDAYENVVLNGVMMGLAPREARARFDDVIEFAELGEYTDMKLKNYSSGMLVRLGFSLATQVDADVLLVDEVLAVGDAAFQQKSFDAFAEQHARGKTIILVTHDMGIVESHCDRALLLDRGDIVASGDPGEVSRRYMELNFPDKGQALRGEEVSVDGGARRAVITDVQLRDPSGDAATTFEQGEPIGIEMTVEASARLERPVFGFEFLNAEGQIVFAPKPTPLPEGRPMEEGEKVIVRARLDNRLASGHYFVNCGVALEFEDLHPVAYRRSAADFVVFGTRRWGGLVELDFDADVEVQQ
jgi:ABC-type polysaccharide/polyol phosphate transport system ATPase subunit